jgi:DNA-binding transcriptional LysR family regulator
VAVAEIAELAGAERGRLRVGSASAMVSADPLPQILRELRERHPRAEVTIVSGTSEALVRQILAGELDMAFVSLPVEARGIQTEGLSRDELVAVASPQHRLAKQKVVSVFALAGEKLILGERGGNTRRLIDELFAEAGVQPVVAMELSRLSAIKRMVEEDMGVGVIPMRAAVEEVAEGRLVAWWIEGAQINWELGLAKLAGDYDSPISHTFARLCKKYFHADAQKPATRQKAKSATEKRKRVASAR